MTAAEYKERIQGTIRSLVLRGKFDVALRIEKLIYEWQIAEARNTMIIIDDPKPGIDRSKISKLFNETIKNRLKARICEKNEN